MTISKVKAGILMGLLVILIAGSVIYNVWDNRRFIVVEEEIILPRLPASFDGFSILLLADLHGAYFGEQQADLLSVINQLDYDMIAFAGDMADSRDASPQDSAAILDLIDGLQHNDLMFWVDGNAGPYALERGHAGAPTGLTDFGVLLQEKGCTVVMLPHSISRGEDRIWIAPEMLEILLQMYEGLDADQVGDEEILASIHNFAQSSEAAFRELKDNGEVKILLNHYPKQTNLTAEQWDEMGWLDYDLILAGHYHGGQIRIPLIGALYVPSPTAGMYRGFFPKQSDVKGLNSVSGIPQYITAGLGSSSSIKLLDFRLFNTPEINLITLRADG